MCFLLSLYARAIARAFLFLGFSDASGINSSSTCTKEGGAASRALAANWERSGLAAREP